MALRNKIQITGGFVKKLAAFLSVLAVAAGAFLFSNTQSHKFLSFAGLPDGTTATITLQQAGKLVTLQPAPEKSGAFEFSAPEKMSGDYKISATLKSGTQYQDLQILVNRRSGEVQLVASGFDPAQEISIRSNDTTISSDLHFDWNGKIELSQPLPVKGTSRLCFTAGSSFTMCHFLPKKAAT